MPAQTRKRRFTECKSPDSHESSQPSHDATRSNNTTGNKDDTDPPSDTPTDSSDDEPTRVCKCGAVIQSEDLYKHARGAVRENPGSLHGEGSHTCACGLTYTSYRHLARHTTTCQLFDSISGARAYQTRPVGEIECVCGFRCNERDLDAHARHALKEDPKSSHGWGAYPCTCGRVFPSEKKRRAHERRAEHGSSGYTCRCGKPCDSRDMLYGHARRAVKKHPGTTHGIGNLHCACGMVFDSEMGRSRHRTRRGCGRRGSGDDERAKRRKGKRAGRGRGRKAKAAARSEDSDTGEEEDEVGNTAAEEEEEPAGARVGNAGEHINSTAKSGIVADRKDDCGAVAHTRVAAVDSKGNSSSNATESIFRVTSTGRSLYESFNRELSIYRSRKEELVAAPVSCDVVSPGNVPPPPILPRINDPRFASDSFWSDGLFDAPLDPIFAF